MPHRTAAILIGVALILIVGGSVYLNKKSKVYVVQPVVTEVVQTATSTPPPPPVTKVTPTTPIVPKKPTPTTPVTPVTPPPVVSGITLAQVAAHNSRTSCWSAVNGSVYDLTSWIPNHPGGEQRILRMCGKDGSNDYNGQHGGSRKIMTILAGFKLDVLAQ